MRHKREHFEPMGLPQIADKRDFDMGRVVSRPDPDQIQADLLRLAAEVHQLGLDTLQGCSPISLPMKR